LAPHEVREVLFGYGHENVQATHHSTLEFTKDTHLSKNGDCILIVATDKGISDFSNEFKEALCHLGAKLIIQIEVGNIIEGTEQLILNHPAEMVIRKSNHISNRTLAIHADKAAKDLSREIVEKLRNPKQKAKITLIVKN
jgi:hypothetical protein